MSSAPPRTAGDILRAATAWLPFLAVGAMLLLQEAVRQGVWEGLVLCGTTLIPALFPFMVMSDLFSSSLSGRKSPASRRFAHLFGLTENAFAIWLTGAVCGVPLGVRETVKAYRAGKMNRRQAEALLPMVGLCGPAFVIAGVGGGMRKSIAEGVWLFVIQLLSSLLSGLLLSLFDRRATSTGSDLSVSRKSAKNRTFVAKTENNRQNLPVSERKSQLYPSVGIWLHGKTTAPESEYAPPTDRSAPNRRSVKSHIRSEAMQGMKAPQETVAPSLPGAIRRAATDLLSVCGSVCLFSAFGRVLLRYLPRLPAALLYALSEVTGGASLIASVFSASPTLSFSLSAGVIAFGGMSIHLQTALFAEGTDLRLGRYFLGKSLSAAIAFGLGSIVGNLLR